MDSIVTMFSGSLSDDLRESSGSCAVANGPAVHVAAAFANEEAYWLALCLKVHRPLPSRFICILCMAAGGVLFTRKGESHKNACLWDVGANRQ